MPEAKKECRDWIADLLGIAVLTALATIPFRWSSLDLDLVRLFYTASGDPSVNHWVLGDRFPWRQLFLFGPWPAVIVSTAAFVLLVASYFSNVGRRTRPHCLFLVAVLLIGPGLVVNGIFKDHWGRPRPRDVVEFGGPLTFHPVLVKGTGGVGKGFPSGHSSTGYYFVAFYFLLRRKRKALAWLSLAATMAYGTLVGVARMAAGAHFPSDVLWSAVMTAGVAFVLYYFVLDIPAREDRVDPALL